MRGLVFVFCLFVLIFAVLLPIGLLLILFVLLLLYASLRVLLCLLDIANFLLNSLHAEVEVTGQTRSPHGDVLIFVFVVKRVTQERDHRLGGWLKVLIA